MLIVYPVMQSTAQLSVSDAHLSERQKGSQAVFTCFQTAIQIFSYAMVFFKKKKSPI